MTAALALLAHEPAKAQRALDDRYPPVFTPPAPMDPVDTRAKRRRPAAIPRTVTAPRTTPAPATVPAIVTAPRPATAMLPAPPRNAALAGVAIDPSWPKQLFVIGDSVMLGAKPQLSKGFPDWQVTFQGRPALMIPKAISELPRYVGPVVVVALGYNSLWQKDRLNFQRWADNFDKTAESMLNALKERGARKIVWVMLRELNSENVPGNGTATMQSSAYGWYFPYVNERLRALKQRHPEIALADWVSAARQGGVTYDAIHLNPRGAELMVNVVRVAVGLDPLPPKTAALTPAAPTPPAPPSSDTTASAPTSSIATPSEQAPKQPEQVAVGPAPAEPPPPEIRKSVVENAPMSSGPLSQPTYAFRDCAACPEMIVLPAASFTMGAPDDEADRGPNEGPQRLVTIARPFAVGKFEVTFAEWEACVAGGGCQGNPSPGDEGWGKDRQPVVNVSWDDAVEYAAWLSRTTGKTYRLLTEAEWEYAARAGTASPFATGATITPEQANFQTNHTADGSSREGEYREQAIAVGSLPPNAFGLHDMHGNVSEWVQDNWHEDHAGAPTDGSARSGGDTSQRVLRGGSWYSLAPEIRSASRRGDQPDHRSGDIGFRIARAL